MNIPGPYMIHPLFSSDYQSTKLEWEKNKAQQMLTTILVRKNELEKFVSINRFSTTDLSSEFKQIELTKKQIEFFQTKISCINNHLKVFASPG